MGITIEIVQIDTEKEVCIVKIQDGAEFVADCANISPN